MRREEDLLVMKSPPKWFYSNLTLTTVPSQSDPCILTTRPVACVRALPPELVQEYGCLHTCACTVDAHKFANSMPEAAIVASPFLYA